MPAINDVSISIFLRQSIAALFVCHFTATSEQKLWQTDMREIN
jgi:hypothetical protein